MTKLLFVLQTWLFAMSHITLKKQSAYLSAQHDLNRTPGSPIRTCKELQLPYSRLLLSPQPDRLTPYSPGGGHQHSPPQTLQPTAKSMAAHFSHSITVPHS